MWNKQRPDPPDQALMLSVMSRLSLIQVGAGLNDLQKSFPT